MHLPVLGTSFSPGSFLRSFICVYLRLPAIARLPPGSCLTAAGPSAGRDRVLVRQLPDRSRSPELSLIKDENTPLASRTPSRRAGTRALPVRGSSAAYVDANGRLLGGCWIGLESLHALPTSFVPRSPHVGQPEWFRFCGHVSNSIFVPKIRICPEGTIGLSLGFQPQDTLSIGTRPHKALRARARARARTLLFGEKACQPY